MRKIISCTVIRTTPLSKSSGELHHARRPNDKPHNISNADAGTLNTKNLIWEPVAIAQAMHTGNSVTYTDRLDITRMSIDDGLTVQVLDLYV